MRDVRNGNRRVGRGERNAWLLLFLVFLFLRFGLQPGSLGAPVVVGCLLLRRQQGADGIDLVLLDRIMQWLFLVFQVVEFALGFVKDPITEASCGRSRRLWRAFRRDIPCEHRPAVAAAGVRWPVRLQ